MPPWRRACIRTIRPRPGRRALHAGGGAALAALAWPALASSRARIAGMTDGPFYPPRAWREQWTDWDADLSRVQRDGRTLVARGEHLGLELQVMDATAASSTAPRSRSGNATCCRLPPPGRAPGGRAVRRGLPGLRRQPQRRATAGCAFAASSRCPTRGARRTSTSSCAMPASAKSPRSCSLPATRAMRATSSGARWIAADRPMLEMSLQPAARRQRPALAGAAGAGAAGLNRAAAKSPPTVKCVKQADRPDSVRRERSCERRAVTAIHLGRTSLCGSVPPTRTLRRAGSIVCLFGVAARRDCPFHPTGRLHRSADSSLLL